MKKLNKKRVIGAVVLAGIFVVGLTTTVNKVTSVYNGYKAKVAAVEAKNNELEERIERLTQRQEQLKNGMGNVVINGEGSYEDSINEINTLDYQISDLKSQLPQK